MEPIELPKLVRDLKDSYWSAEVQGDTVPDSFIPYGAVDRLVTPEVVRRCLQSEVPPAPDAAALFDFVMDKQCPAKKLFLICIATGLKEVGHNDNLSKALRDFQEARLSDSCLPLKFLEHPADFTFFKAKRQYGQRNEFEDKQWKYMAPVFSHAEPIVELKHAKHPLPYTFHKESVAQGGFGTVSWATIHEDHRKHKAFELGRGDVAIKTVSHVENEGDFYQEVGANIAISKLNHPHIVKFIAGITKPKNEKYLMFQWANGGDLKTYWSTVPQPKLSSAFVKSIMVQFHGLMHALDALHSLGPGTMAELNLHPDTAKKLNLGTEDLHVRHTDIKPSNILRLISDSADANKEIGTLMLADMGLAKRHKDATAARTLTTAMAATIRYEPPESTLSQKKLSRRYDVWSMGCVMLELIIWMLHGSETLDKFNSTWLKTETVETVPFFERLRDKSFRLHPVVKLTMEKLRADQECKDKNTAIYDLLDMVQSHMLVIGLGDEKKEDTKLLTVNSRTGTGIKLSSDSPANRAYTSTLVRKMDNMMKKGAKDDCYWYSGQSRDGLELSDPRPHIADVVFRTPVSATFGKDVSTRSNNEYRNINQLNDTWDYVVDNDFAARLLSSGDWAAMYPRQEMPPRLCDRCRGLDLTFLLFTMTDTRSLLQQTQTTCDFCRMRWRVCRDIPYKNEFQFRRIGCVLQLAGRSRPVFSICGTSQQNHNIPIGFPRVPAPGSEASMAIIRQWLSDCDEHHPSCLVSSSGSPRIVPTRLLDLKADSNAGEAQRQPFIRLYQTQPQDTMEYVALSHPWGAKPHFCTTRDNIDRFTTSGFHPQELPQTFRHAVEMTRALGVRYLWIDSLCIIQGQDGDFADEAEKMESVFSFAYCVLAACSATKQTDGMFGRRPADRRVVALTGRKGAGSLVYVCEFVDDFNGDVLQSNLSKRGWVLQERALARRTVYFTHTQAYWECGEGVRSASLAKMNNKLASFLGDPNFPSKISGNNSLRGEKIMFYESLYQQYSRLYFSVAIDRAVAIRGLEHRLIRDLKAHGGFGVFDDGRSLLQHSLLWHRSPDVAALTRIDFSASGSHGQKAPLAPPSWSWMAYHEGIDFLELPLGAIEWLPEEAVSPWRGARSGENSGNLGLSGRQIRVLTRSFDRMMIGDGDNNIVYDVPAAAKNKEIRCVLLGKAKSREKKDLERTFYILFVTPTEQRCNEERLYERVGVGSMSGRHLTLDKGEWGRLE